MTKIHLVNGQNEIYNDAGLRIIGNTDPNRIGLSPKELLEAALGLCISISLQELFEHDGIEYDRFPICVEVTAKKEQGVTDRFTNFHVLVKLPPTLDSEYRHKVISVVESACTIGNTLKGEAIVETLEI